MICFRGKFHDSFPFSLYTLHEIISEHFLSRVSVKPLNSVNTYLKLLCYPAFSYRSECLFSYKSLFFARLMLCAHFWYWAKNRGNALANASGLRFRENARARQPTLSPMTSLSDATLTSSTRFVVTVDASGSLWASTKTWNHIFVSNPATKDRLWIIQFLWRLCLLLYWVHRYLFLGLFHHLSFLLLLLK